MKLLIKIGMIFLLLIVGSIFYNLKSLEIKPTSHVVVETSGSFLIANYAPRQILDIPDQTWDENTQLNDSFDLDSYFSDDNGDIMSYTVSGNTNIVITIDSANVVSFDPTDDWSGAENVVFKASDGDSSTDSNSVKLTVEEVEDEDEEEEPESGGAVGGGGGGGSGGGGAVAVPISMEEGDIKPFDVEITMSDSILEAGQHFDFTYSVEAITDISEDLVVDYWIEKDGKKLISGRDVVYKDFKKEVRQSGLQIGKEIIGDYDFYIRFRLGEYSATAHQPIKIMYVLPPIPDMGSIELIKDDMNVIFMVDIGHNKDRAYPFSIDEKLIKEGEVVWKKTKEVMIKEPIKLREEITDLDPGKYIIRVAVSYGNERVEIEKLFTLVGSKFEYLAPLVKNRTLTISLAVMALTSIIVLVKVLRKSKNKIPKKRDLRKSSKRKGSS